MYFNPFLLVLVLSLTVSSCKWVGESKLEPQRIEINGQIDNCFGDAGKSLEKFLKSTLETPELESILSCSERSIDDFIRKTSERDPSLGYSRDEVKSLLNTFMLKNSSEAESDRYARIFLIIKRMLIGGSTDYLSRKDWAKIKTLLPKIREFAINIKLYTQYYYFYNKDYYEPKRHNFGLLASGHDQFAKRLGLFLDFLKSNGSQLNKIELQILKDELIRNETLNRIDPLLSELIHIFFSFPPSQHQENWSNLFRIAEKGLRVMTYVKKMGLQKDSIFMPQGGVAVVALVHSIIDAFEFTHVVNSSNNLEQQLVENFIVSLSESQLFLKNIEDPEVIRQFVANIGQSIFVPEDLNQFSLDNTNISERERNLRWHISRSKINQFKFIHNRWVQSLINALDDTSFRELKEQYENLLFAEIDFDANYEKEADDIFRNVAKTSAVNLVFPGLEYKVNFQVPRSLSQQSDAISNFYRTMLSNVVLFIFDTYGDQARLETSLDKHVVEGTAKRFYKDIRALTVAEGIGSPLSCDSGGRTFLEANLFTFSANGNEKIEIHEGLEWLSLVTSASSVASRLFNEIAAKPECVLPTTSIFQNKPYLDKECVRSHILENYRSHFNHMPNLIRFLEIQGNIDDFYQNLFEVTRTCDNPNLPVSYDETIYSVSLLGYIEALFERYDVETVWWKVFKRERDDLLQMDELTLAFEERFKNILKRMAKQQNNANLNDSQAAHLFKKLLIYKRLPESPVGKWEEIQWLAADSMARVRPLNRIDIYKVFNSILTLNEISAAGAEYCENLAQAWEEYQQIQVFKVDVPENSCEDAAVAVPRNNRGNSNSMP